MIFIMFSDGEAIAAFGEEFPEKMILPGDCAENYSPGMMISALFEQSREKETLKREFDVT